MIFFVCFNLKMLSFILVFWIGLLVRAEIPVFQQCPPADLVHPCECYGPFFPGDLPMFQCLENSNIPSFDMKALFANISATPFAKDCQGIMWFNDHVTEIPDFVFGSTKFHFINIGGLEEESRIERISPKAFLNFETKTNQETEMFRWKYIPKLSFQEMVDVVCVQLENIRELGFDSGSEKTIFEAELSPDYFWSCQNRKLTTLSFVRIEIGLVKSFLKFIPEVTQIAILDSRIESLEAFAFGRETESESLTINFGKLEINRMDPKSLLGMRAQKATIELWHPLLLATHEEAFLNYLEESPKNTINLAINQIFRIDCNCSFKWLHENWNKFQKQIRISQEEFICQNGKQFANLTKADFAHCASIGESRYYIGFWIGISVGLAAVVFIIGFIILRQRLRRALRRCYQMKRTPRGICLIVNNINFAESTNLTSRIGSEVDEAKLSDLFAKTLLFEVVVLRNATADEMKSKFQELSQNGDLERHDAFVCVILSHGGLADLVYGVDGAGVSVHDVTKAFNDENCVGLRGKPKMFFFNACRGGKCYKMSTLSA